MKKIFILSFIAILTLSKVSPIFAADESGSNTINPCGSGLQYQLVSYEKNNNSGQTPLFNIDIFNKPCFELGRGNYENGFQFLFDLAVGVSVALAVILFTIGATQGILSDAAGYDLSIKGIKKGKQAMQNAIVGLLVVLSIWLVVNTVNPDLLRLPMLQSLGQMGISSGGGNTPSSVRVCTGGGC